MLSSFFLLSSLTSTLSSIMLLTFLSYNILPKSTEILCPVLVWSGIIAFACAVFSLIIEKKEKVVDLTQEEIDYVD